MSEARRDASPLPEGLEATIEEARGWLRTRMAGDGHLVFDLEADATIPAEYVFLNHFLGEPDDALEARIGVYLRRIQNTDGSWPLFHDGDMDLSATIKGYYALKIIGDDPDAPHMARARARILEAGGAERANVFTRFALAIFGQIPWKGVPYMPVEVLLFPKWMPFHIEKVSYWSRTVMVPLLVLGALKPRARNPRGVHVQELFRKAPARIRRWQTNPTGHWLGKLLLAVDWLGHRLDPLVPLHLERRAIDWAMTFVRERLNGEDGLGGIFPAMANAVMAMDALGYPRDHPDYVIARKSVDKLLVHGEDETWCQPCLSPVWDTGLAAHAFLEAGDDEAARRANDWLKGRQILHLDGDWITRRPDLRPGGWAFQYWNDYYPDVDDTAVVGMALDRDGDPAYREAIDRAAEWIIGMQSANGGWGAFDADNEYYFLEHIPFADHGALLDPPTVDVSARCLSFLAQIGYGRDHPVVDRGIDYIASQQEADGSWFGRWGTNYVYGTWSVLCALNVLGEDMAAPWVRKAVDWLVARQRPDGGWGEDCATYWDGRRDEAKASTPSQTAWAVLGLMAAGEVDSEAARRGVEWLLAAPRNGGLWQETYYNAVGFPRVFYLRYHGYPAYFPLWALARYRNLRQGNALRPAHGM